MTHPLDIKMSMEFTVTEEHLKLLRHLSIHWLSGDNCYAGAPVVDMKRPYGNSDVERDICDVLGWKYDPDDGPSSAQKEAALKIHEQMDLVLQIAVQHAVLAPGKYRSQLYFDWSPVK